MADRLAQLMKLHETDPADAFVTYGIGLEHMKTGNAQEALDWLDKTLVNDAGYSYAYYQKALALKQMGRTDEASAAVQKGIEVAQAAGDQKAVSELQDLGAMID